MVSTLYSLPLLGQGGRHRAAAAGGTALRSGLVHAALAGGAGGMHRRVGVGVGQVGE